eukprot:3348179-Amphidinium_carterae.1
MRSIWSILIQAGSPFSREENLRCVQAKDWRDEKVLDWRDEKVLCLGMGSSSAEERDVGRRSLKHISWLMPQEYRGFLCSVDIPRDLSGCISSRIPAR